MSSEQPESPQTAEPVHVAAPDEQQSKLAAPQEFLALGRYLYNHNPFYPLSAVLILLGLHSLFHDEHAARNLTDIGFNNAVLWLVLAGYAVVLAGTAVWIIRWGQIWDDARTILLTLVLLLVAMSVNCDKPISLHIASAPWLLIGGLVFASALSEATLILTGLRLPLLMRLPMHLLLVLFFLYPIALDYCLNTIGEQRNALGWRDTLLGVLLFPSVAALIVLTLIPAAARGPGWIAQPTPAWRWPYYPWSLYVVLGIAVVFRSFYLTISFHPRAGTDSAFAPYFLTSFVIATAAVAFELGRSAQHRLTQHIALATPLLWILFALTGQPPCDPAGDFLCIHRDTIGSPMQVVVAGLLALYGYAWLRGGPAWIASGVVGLACLAAVVGPHTVDLRTFGPTNWQPLAVAAGLCAYGVWRTPASSLRWFAAMSMALWAISTAAEGTMFVQYRGALPWHLWLIATAMIGVLGSDSWAQALRALSAAILVALAYGVVIYSARSWYGLAPWTAWAYLLGLTTLTWLVWLARRGTDQLATATLVSVAAAAQSALATAAVIRQSSNPRAWVLVLAGIACFVAGLIVSSMKMSAAAKDPKWDGTSL